MYIKTTHNYCAIIIIVVMQVREFSLCRYHNCGCIAGCFGVYIDDSYNNMRDICSWCKEKKQLVRYSMLGKYHVAMYLYTFTHHFIILNQSQHRFIKPKYYDQQRFTNTCL